LRSLGHRIRPFDEVAPGKRYQFRLSDDPKIELLTSIERVSFEAAWPDSIETLINDIEVKVLSKCHLIINKQALGRVKDLEDVKALLTIE